jgi:hypothetical protein
MSDQTAVNPGTQIQIDVRKASQACKLPYVYSNVVLASRVGQETTIEFGFLNHNDVAVAVVEKRGTAEIEATMHTRIFLTPAATLTLQKQLNAVTEALLKEFPQIAGTVATE